MMERQLKVHRQRGLDLIAGKRKPVALTTTRCQICGNPAIPDTDGLHVCTAGGETKPFVRYEELDSPAGAYVFEKASSVPDDAPIIWIDEDEVYQGNFVATPNPNDQP